tara:strand:+ start:8359 stop:9057 length:699 start_codon:yes stop_codon:yes gene_type:complete
MSHLMTARAMQTKGLRATTKIVLYWLADHYNGETGRCFPSIKRLSKLSEMSQRSVRSQIDVLVSMQLVEIKKSYRPDGQQTSNNYILYLSEDMAQGGVQNLQGGGENIAGVGVQNLHTNNLVSNNLVSKPVLRSCEIGFKKFWDDYPRKIGKANAQKAFSKASQEVGVDKILEAVKPFADSVVKKEKKYIPHPATWLTQGRWDDELEEIAPTSSADYLDSLFKGGVLGVTKQ